MTCGKQPTKAQATRLLTQVDQLVLRQTNIFIRELLRELGKRPGANKQESRASLEEAIADGTLCKPLLDEWLHSVEGWGNQLVHPRTVPDDLAAAEEWDDVDAVHEIAEGAFPGAWRAAISDRYPPEPELTRIDYDPARRVFLAEWHKRTERWVRDAAADIRRSQGGDDYWFKANRLEPSRAVMRYALWLAPLDQKVLPIGALFVRLPFTSKEHAAAEDIAWRDLDKLVVAKQSLSSWRGAQWDVSRLVKLLDSRIQRNRQRGFSTEWTEFAEGKASVKFTAPPDRKLPPTIRQIRLAMPARATRSRAFAGAAGDFWREADPAPERRTSREAHVRLFQKGNHLRILTELEEDDVWSLLEVLGRLVAHR